MDTRLTYLLAATVAVGAIVAGVLVADEYFLPETATLVDVARPATASRAP